MDNLSKINFETPKEEVKKSEADTDIKKSPRLSDNNTNISSKFKKLIKNKRFQVGFLIALLLFIFIALGVGIPAVNTYKSAKATYAQAKITQDAIKQQNVDLASSELIKTKTALADTQKNLHSMFYLKFIPIASWYYNDADHLINAGFHGLDAATILIDSIKPYADLLGLKGQGSFVGGTAEQRVETAVKTMSKITPKIDDIADKLSLARQEIDQVSPNHYPAIGPGKKIRNGFETLRSLTDQSVDLINSSRPLIKIL